MQSEPTKAELADIRAKAEAAKARGPASRIFGDFASFTDAANPATIIALLDAIEARDKRIAALERAPSDKDFERAGAWARELASDCRGDREVGRAAYDAMKLTPPAPSEATN